jgi:hypothetical protein
MGSVRIDEGPAVRPTRRPAPADNGSRAPDSASNTAPKAPREDPELERILQMVEAGQLSARDADELLRAMGRV